MQRKMWLYLVTAILSVCVLSLKVFGIPASTAKDVSVKQDQFITFILDESRMANQEILQQRDEILKLYKIFQANQTLTVNQEIWLKEIAFEYKLADLNFSQNVAWQDLLTRVAPIPNSLVIAQAVNESAWGTSRFARNGNNYFGQWCYSQGCGLIPLQRDADGDYQLRTFPNALSSVKSYMNNLNTTEPYATFRHQREALSNSGKPLTGLALVESLTSYSSKGSDYVTIIRDILIKYNLSQYD